MIRIADYVIELVLGSLVILVGLVTNCLSARVFWHQGFTQHHVNVTLLGLALSDLTCLTCAAVYRFSYLQGQFTWWYERVILPFGLSQVAMCRVTFCLTALLSLERWISVCHPLRARSWLRKSNLTQATVITALFSIALNVPALLVKAYSSTQRATNDTSDSGAIEALNGKTNSTAGLCWMDAFTTLNSTACRKIPQLPMSDVLVQESFETNTTTPKSESSFLSSDDPHLAHQVMVLLLTPDANITYVIVCTLVVFPGICNNLVTFCTVSIILKLRKMSRKRLSLLETPNGQNPADMTLKISVRETRLVKSILAVMIIFIVCHSPTSAWAHAILFGGATLLRKQPILHSYLMTGFMFLETVNSSVNFFVYITYFPGFKRSFKQLYPCFPLKNTERKT